MTDYSWVLWFRELACKIANGCRSDLPKKLRECVALHKGEGQTDPEVEWPKDEGVDPLSFIYDLAVERREDELMRRLRIVDRVFDINADCPQQRPHIIPKLTLRVPFDKSGDGEPDLLWELLRAAVVPGAIGDLFDKVLKSRSVDAGVPKLTQALFIINADVFYPVDTNCQQALGRGSAKVLWQEEFKGMVTNYDEYDRRLKALKTCFPCCRPYEISTFLDKAPSLLAGRSVKCFHISTNVDDDSQDQWGEFRDKNAVWTGVPAPPAGTRYPLAEPKPGNVILVRYGRLSGRGIGVVAHNGYSGGWSGDKRIAVFWINKQTASLTGKTSQRGFGSADADRKTYQAFNGAKGYRETLKVIDRLATTPKQAAEKGDGAVMPLNQVLYGPPGTSKTFDAVSLAVEVIYGMPPSGPEDRTERFKKLTASKQVEFVTFHQNYAYEDFIEGIRPVLSKAHGDLRYKLHNGIFKRIAKRASKDLDHRYVLIVDEINRGNIAKIFGELITLIESSKRLGEEEMRVTLPYSKERFGVPPNLYLIGTMNTADRGIAPLDVALRRRFEFEERMPDVGKVAWEFEGVNGSALLRAINDRIVENLDREHQIGHTYLMKVDGLDALARVFRTQIIPLLQEYFYDDWEKMRRVLNDNAFITMREAGERAVFDVLPPDGEAWRQAHSYQAIYGNSGNPTDE